MQKHGGRGGGAVAPLKEICLCPTRPPKKNASTRSGCSRSTPCKKQTRVIPDCRSVRSARAHDLVAASALRSEGSEVVQSRPFRALAPGTVRCCCTACCILRLRSQARRSQSIPPMAAENAGTSGSRHTAGRRGDDRSAGPRRRQRGRPRDRGSASGRDLQSRREDLRPLHVLHRRRRRHDGRRRVRSRVARRASRARQADLFYDDNNVSLAGPTSVSFDEDVNKRFEAYGWHTMHVDDEHANDVDAIDKVDHRSEAAYATSRRSSRSARQSASVRRARERSRPTASRSAPTTSRRPKNTSDGRSSRDFIVPDEVLAFWRERAAAERKGRKAWDELYASYKKRNPDLSAATRADALRQTPDADLADVQRGERQRRDARCRRHRDERDRERSSRARRRLGRPRSVDEDVLERIAATSSPARTPAGTSTSACASTPWARSPTALQAHGGLLPFAATFFNFLDYMKPALPAGRDQQRTRSSSSSPTTRCSWAKTDRRTTDRAARDAARDARG